MARDANRRGLTLSAALLSLTADTLRAMMARLSTPKPRPTRKADMIEAIERRLAGESLPRIWDGLDEIQKFAVSEVLYGMEGGFNPNQFKAKYGAMPEGLSPLDSRGSRDHVSLRLFLYSGDRYADSPMVIPAGLAERPASHSCRRPRRRRWSPRTNCPNQSSNTSAAMSRRARCRLTIESS